MDSLYIFRKEIKSYFVSPVIYVVIGIFLVLSGYFFYTDLVLFNWVNIKGTSSVVEGLWQYYFNDIRFVFLLIVPLITMRTFSEEKKLGTMELIRTYPVRDFDIVVGKFLACLAVFLLMVGLTFTNVLFIGYIWDFTEIMPVFAGYVGVLFLGFALISAGIFISSLTENQLVAAIATLGLFVFLWFLTWNEMIGSQGLIDLLKRISLFDRVHDFFRGVMNSRDLAYFILLGLLFVFLTLRSLGAGGFRREYSGRPVLDGIIGKSLYLGIPVLAVLAIFIALEIVSYNHNWRKDLTPDQRFTLSEQSGKILDALNEKVKFTTYYRPGEYAELDDFFQRLRGMSQKIEYELIDLDRNPGKAGMNNIAAYGQTIVEAKGGKLLINYPTEERAINAVIRLTSGKKNVAYLTMGHGENNIEQRYSELGRSLKAEAWETQGLWLMKEKTIPEDAGVIIIGGPAKDFLEGELQILSHYLREGGRVILLLEPFNDLPRLFAFLKKYGLDFHDDVVVDKVNKLSGGEALTPLISLYLRHPITQSLRSAAVFSSARSIEIGKEASAGIVAQPLAMSSAESWTKSAGDIREGETGFRDGADKKGPIPVAVLVEITAKEDKAGEDIKAVGEKKKNKKGIIVCFGDADFISNKFFDVLGNKDLFLNTLDWAVSEEDMISIRSRKFEYPYHFMSEDQGRWALILPVFVLPAIFLAMGAAVFIYRRRHG